MSLQGWGSLLVVELQIAKNAEVPNLRLVSACLLIAGRGGMMIRAGCEVENITAMQVRFEHE